MCFKQGNESALENWDKYFQVGPHGSNGYEKCFKPNPTDLSEVKYTPICWHTKRSFKGKQKCYSFLRLIKWLQQITKTFKVIVVTS